MNNPTETLTETAMLRAMDHLDTIQTHTGITTEHRARVWMAVEDPHENWINAARVKITPVRTLAGVVAKRSGIPSTRVPERQHILDALEAVTTPRETTPREATPPTADL